MKQQSKKLKKSANKVIFGVFGGIAEYYQINANILRIGYIIVAIVLNKILAINVSLWIGIYILLAVIMPAAQTKKTRIFQMFNEFRHVQDDYSQNTHDDTTNKNKRKIINAVEVDEEKEKGNK
ncbi:phage shock protein C [Weissella beninensis]|uniref:PspC domain-containing protein n=1 Tax=Periweissella beninensis TaxID=504936 RepID=A0ABT0VJ24_9LACO|nr:PspC domain-containing protein [Periweissella beninensis]MBM7544401.1 phage shock protein C [Periweissella beninensis]MCM2437833.1 PspC domain-containing protein [Periweissella beninensis]